MSATGDGSAIKISDFCDLARWHESEVYARVYAPMGIEHQMALALPAPRPAVVGLALSRVDVDADFSGTDRALLDRLRPYLTQSWRNARDHAQIRRLLDTAGRALTSVGSSVLLLTDPVQELTPGALTELYRYLGRPSELDPLPLRAQRWLETERRRRSSSPVAPLSRPLVARRNGRQLTVRLLPGDGGDSDVLVMTVTDTSGIPSHLEALGLSPREAQILELVATGATNAGIATRLHLAPATVRHHLEHVYRNSASPAGYRPAPSR